MIAQKIRIVQPQRLIFKISPYSISTVTGADGENMELNKAVSQRLSELLKERKMTQYQLFMKTGVPKSTIGNIINCSYPSVKLRVLHEVCQGLDISLTDFFNSPLFYEINLEP